MTPYDADTAARALIDQILTVGDDYLSRSPAPTPRTREDRKATSVRPPDPTADTVADPRRQALSLARADALRLLAFIERRAEELRVNLAAAHAAWLGESELPHNTES